MEPISIIFSSFLAGMTGDLTNHITNVMGTEVQVQIVEYQNQQIDYQYQLWKVKDPSVCARIKTNDLSHYSSCTLIAKTFFTDTCSYLQTHPQQNWKYTKLKNMYCLAAVNFKPTIAQISRPTEAESKLWDAKQKCSLLTLNARSTGSRAVAKQRDKACEEYQKIKPN
tara:strand:+ start:83875 stop:84378 length:504 start_codon:yes stop_codon:yes gene_type:complete